MSDNDLKVVSIGETASGGGVVELLEQALEVAKTGGIVNASIILVSREGDVMTKYANEEWSGLLVTGCEVVKLQILTADEG